MDYDIEVNGRIRVTRILKDGQGLWGIKLMKVHLPDGTNIQPGQYPRCGWDGWHEC